MPKTEITTPYQKAKQVWDERLGSAHTQAKNWRLMAIISGLLCLGLLASLIISLNNHKAKLYVAQVANTGQIINIAPLRERYQPTQAEEEYFLTHFIKLIRSLPLDPVVAKQNWLQAYDFLTTRAATQLSTLMRKNNPLNLLGKETISTAISDINPLSQNTYQIDWSEKTVDKNGAVISTQYFSGVFNIMIKAPNNEKEILNNPLGIYITDLHLSARSKP